MIDELQARLLAARQRPRCLDKAGHEGARVGVALHEGMDGLAIGSNRGANDAAGLVGMLRRRAHRIRAAGHCAFVRGARIVDHDGDVFDAVTVQGDVSRDRVVGQ